MKFAQLGAVGEEIPVVVVGEQAFDLRGITREIDGAFLENGAATVQGLLTARQLPEVMNPGSLRVGSPIGRPSAIICVGMNYAAHAAESGSAPPENMVIFNKLPNTIAGPNDTVVIPKGSEKTDWEVELGIVIGKRASYIESVADAADHIAGYVLVNDLSERTWQLEISGGQWGKGKSCAGFTPVGPWLVTPDEIGGVALGMRSFVNGEPRQDSTTADMIFNVEHIVHELSQYMVLEPGDLVLTGTPEGVALSGRFPYLKAGDTVELEIDGLGQQQQTYVAFQETVR